MQRIRSRHKMSHRPSRRRATFLGTAVVAALSAGLGLWATGDDRGLVCLTEVARAGAEAR